MVVKLKLSPNAYANEAGDDEARELCRRRRKRNKSARNIVKKLVVIV